MADNLEDIFNVSGFNLQSISAEVKDAVNALNTLEDATQSAGKSTLDMGKKIDGLSVAKSISEFKSLSDTIRNTFNGSGIDNNKLDAIIANFTNDIPKLKGFLKDLKNQMVQLDGKEFSDMQKYVQGVEKEIKNLEFSSKNTKSQFKELAKNSGDLSKEQLIAAGKLRDSVADQSAQIKILSSDTKKTDFGLAAIELAANGYQVLAGGMQLFGVSQEDSMAAMAKLQSIMAITTGLQQIQNALLKEGTLATLAMEGATVLAAQANAILATSMGGLKIALASTGIGLLVVALGYLAVKMYEASEATAEFEKQGKANNEVTKKSIEQNGEQIIKLELLNETIKKGNLTQEQRKRAVIDYNAEFGKTLGFVKDYNQLESKMIANGDNYIKYMKAKAEVDAAYGLIVDANKKKLIAQSSSDKDFQSGLDATIGAIFNPISTKEMGDNYLANTGGIAKKKAIKDAEKDAENYKTAFDEATKKMELAQSASKINSSGYVESKIDKATKKVKADAKVIENIYAKELAEISDKIAGATATDFLSKENIAAKYVNDVVKFEEKIKKAVKAKQLTTNQGEDLKQRNKQLIGLLESKDIKEFEQKAYDAQKSIEKSILAAKKDSEANKILLIEDEFKRETAKIESEYVLQQQVLLDAKNALQNDLAAKYNVGLIDPDTMRKQTAEIEAIYTTQLNSLALINQQKQKDLQFKIYESSQKSIQDEVNKATIILDTLTNIELKAEADKYLRGEIKYDEYQKRITKIAYEETIKRLENENKAIDEQIKYALEQLNSGTLNASQTDKVNAELFGLQNKKSKNNEQISSNKVSNKNNDAELNRILKNIDAYNQLANSALNAIATIEDAEIKALDKKIARQEKQLEKAKRLSENGNNALFEIEQQRLTKLNAEREKAARRQLQIESAIQASSILTAIAGATAKIAKPGASTVDVISSIAVIISSLASGYALVKSYQDAAPKFFKGTDKVGGRYDYTNGTDRIMQGGKSKDDVPAWLHNGESVIQADMAEKYRPLIKAIRADNFIGIQKYISPGTYMPKQNITINNAITPAHIDALIQAVQSTKMDVKLDQNGFVASLTNIIDSRNKRASL